MILIDSCGWIELITDASNADAFEKAAFGREKTFLPTICLQEIYRHLLGKRGKEVAGSGAALVLSRVELIPHTSEIALEAGFLGHKHGLALADAIVYACAKLKGAVLWTQDGAFEDLEGVHFIKKR